MNTQKSAPCALLLCVLLLCVPAFALSDASLSADYAEIYRAQLDRFYALIADCSPDPVMGEAETGIWEIASGLSADEALESIGYAITDLSGDGVPELLIGAISSSDGTHFYGSELCALYTCSSGVPQYVCEGWARSRYLLLDDGRFLYEGSNGAMYSIFGVYALSPSAMLQCEDYYFTYEKDKSFEEIGYYHNQTGAWDPAQAQEMADPDDFYAIWDALSRHTALMELTPFSAYGANTSDAAVSVRWAVSASDDEQPMVAFTARRTVRDFQILSLSLDCIDASGMPIFSGVTLYALDTFEPGNRITAGMTFNGAIPNNGIAYVDENGVTRRFTLDISGKDGSLCLTAF